MHLPGHRKKVLHEGGRAEAVVIGSTQTGFTQVGYTEHKLVLEVHFPDGTQAEAHETVNDFDVGLLRTFVGSVLPVRYDPRDRSAVFVDVPLIKVQNAEQAQRRDQAEIERARRAVAGGANPAVANPAGRLMGVVGQLAELAELKRQLDSGAITQEEFARRRDQLRATTPPG